ncbi:MAG: ABC transporter permease subunit, partial [Pseudolabrys sp.]
RLWKRMTKIVLPAAFERINVGLRVSAAISLVVAVTVEIVLNPRGLGYNLILAEQSLQIGLMWAQLVWLCLLGYVLNLVLSHVGRGPAAIWRPL